MRMNRAAVFVGGVWLVALGVLCGCVGMETRQAMGQHHWTKFDDQGALEHRNDGTAHVVLDAEVDTEGTWKYHLESIPSDTAGDTVQAGWVQQAKNVETLSTLARDVINVALPAIMADRADARTNEPPPDP